MRLSRKSSPTEKNSRPVATGAALGVVLCPVITEKSHRTLAERTYVFVVAQRATKSAIASAIKAAYGVTVLSVHTARTADRMRRGSGGRRITIAGEKKAYVTIASGQEIVLFEGATSTEKAAD